MEQFMRGSEWSKRASTGPQKENTRSYISFITAFRKKTKYLRNIGKKTIELILCLIIKYVDLVPHLKVLPSGPSMEEQILILVQRGPTDFSKDSISRRTWFISCSKCPSTPPPPRTDKLSNKEAGFQIFVGLFGEGQWQKLGHVLH